MSKILMPRRRGATQGEALGQIFTLFSQGMNIAGAFDKLKLYNEQLKETESKRKLTGIQLESEGIKLEEAKERQKQLRAFEKGGNLPTAEQLLIKVRNKDKSVAADAELKEIRKEKAKVDLKNSLAQAKDKVFDRTSKLRNEWGRSAVTKDTQKLTNAFNKILRSQNSPAGDLSLIFQYMKILDPGSTVREGEFANVENAAGVPTQIRQRYNKVISGEKLLPQQRMEYIEQAKDLYESQLQVQELYNKALLRVSSEQGLKLEKNPFPSIRLPEEYIQKEIERFKGAGSDTSPLIDALGQQQQRIPRERLPATTKETPILDFLGIDDLDDPLRDNLQRNY